MLLRSNRLAEFMKKKKLNKYTENSLEIRKFTRSKTTFLHSKNNLVQDFSISFTRSASCRSYIWNVYK